MTVHLLHVDSLTLSEILVPGTKTIEIPPGVPTPMPTLIYSEVLASSGTNAGPVYTMDSAQVAAKMIERFAHLHGLVVVPETREGYRVDLDIESARKAAEAALDVALRNALATYVRHAHEDMRANRPPVRPSGQAKKAIERFNVDLGAMGIRMVGQAIEKAKSETDAIEELKRTVAEQSKQIAALLAANTAPKDKRVNREQ